MVCRHEEVNKPTSQSKLYLEMKSNVEMLEEINKAIYQ